MIMIELEALNWSFQLLLYIYDMISGMSRADVKKLISYSTFTERFQFLRLLSQSGKQGYWRHLLPLQPAA